MPTCRGALPPTPAAGREFGAAGTPRAGCLGVPLSAVALVALMMGGPLLVVGVPYRAYEDWRYARDGAVTDTGRVAGKTARPVDVGDRWDTSYYLEVCYEDDGGVTHRVSDLVPQEEWDRRRVGDPLPPVEYLRADPGTHRPAGSGGQWRSCLVLGAGLVAAAWVCRRAAAWVSGRR